MESFTARFDIAALDSATLVKYGCQYAYTQEYSIDELGRLALHTRIEDMQTSSHAVTVGGKCVTSWMRRLLMQTVRRSDTL